MLPIHLYALFGPFSGPRHQYLLGSSLTWTLDDIYAPPQCLLDPVCALILSAVAGIHPQVTEARKSPLCPIQQRLDPLSKSITLALCTFTLSTKPSVSSRICCFLPLTFLPPS